MNWNYDIGGLWKCSMEIKW